MGLKVPTLPSQAGSTDNQPLPFGAFQKSPIDITKTLLSDAIQNNEVITLLQDQIEQLEQDAKEEIQGGGEETTDGLSEEENSMPLDLGAGSGSDLGSDFGGSEPPSGGEETPEPSEEPGGEELPTPSDLGIDFTDNSQA